MNIVTPENVGFSSQRLQRFDSLLQGYIDSGLLPNAMMLVARHGEVAYFNHFGLADYARQRPVAEDTIYRIYSMSKPVTSVAVMMLLEEGHFQLDDPVSLFIPEFENVEIYVNDQARTRPDPPVTIHHLLTHTAGLTYDFLDTSPVDTLYEQADLRNRDVPLEQWIKRLTAQPLVFQPGENWRYSMATDVLGYLVQAVSGKPFEAFLQERIFDPLGMVDTAFYVPPEKVDRFAEVYGVGRWVIGPEHLGDFTQKPAWPSGGGGLVGTVNDYLRFCRMLANGGTFNGQRIISRKTMEVMTMNHVPVHLFPLTIGKPMHGYGFGLGFNVLLDVAASGRVASAGEYGWSGAAGTHFWIDPVEDIIAIFMTQVMHRDEDQQPVITRSYQADLRTLVYQALE